jgi:hypothetical protein
MYRVQGADQKEYGPIPPERVREWIAQGRLNPQSLASSEGAPGWKPLGEFPEFAADLAARTTTPAPIPTSSASPGPGPTLISGPGAAPRQNVLATVTLVLGIASMALVCCCYGLPFNVAGIVCGFIALSQLRSTPNQSGRNFAIAGLVLSFLSLALGLVFLLIGVAFNPEVLKNLRR